MSAPTADQQLLESMQALSHNGAILEFEPGAVIFRAGDRGDCMFGVLEGRVRLTWGDGSQAEILSAGQCFGQGALVQPERRRHGTATALEPTRLVLMQRQGMLFALDQLPVFGLQLLESTERRLQTLRALVA
ncbi:Crp/Fnr family transcriptional regulator [Cyanobium sp. CH-040]|uniref:Crp/Fnr family transcriptional regulator n=1 Tax=Cyanobium sp. CH-040 TaxID=2823708 RepID=UPI0020CD8C88|nr:cyclic nucleotide-binding domain-containing protein [Cyanobium sp. CH-040]